MGAAEVLVSEGEGGKPSAQPFEGVNPILPVSSLRASLDYYVQKLRFGIVWQTPYFACVARGKCHLFLCEGDQGRPGAWVWIGTENAEQVWAEYQASGAKLRHPPTNYEWALEFQVEDLDGNVLRIGSDNKPDEPVGEWLGMHGRRWVRQGDGYVCLKD